MKNKHLNNDILNLIRLLLCENKVHKNKDYENADISKMLKFLKKNKVPIIKYNTAIKNRMPQLWENESFQKYIIEEEKIYNESRNHWQIVKDVFEKNEIETIFIKSVDIFDYKSSNLDVLIKQEKRKQAENILRKLGYIQLHNVEEPFKTLFRKYLFGNSVSVIHLHNKVAWINAFHNEEKIWDRYQNSDDKTVNIPSQEDSILILSAHWFYEDKEICLSDIIKLRKCFDAKYIDYIYMDRVAKEKGWRRGLYFSLLVYAHLERKILGQSKIETKRIIYMENMLPLWMRNYLYQVIYKRHLTLPFYLPKMFGKYLHYIKTIKDKSITIKSRIYELFKVTYASLFVVLFYKYNINIRYQPSMLITMSGVDGTGKTLYAEYLYKKFKFCEIRANYFWSRVGSSGLIKACTSARKNFCKLVNIKNQDTEKQVTKNYDFTRRQTLGKKKWFKTIGLGILLGEVLLQYIWNIKIPLIFRKVVICDRYIYDSYVDLVMRYGINLESIEAKIFMAIADKCTSKPDLAIVYFAPIEELIERKNFNINEINQAKIQIESYKKMKEKYRLYEISTSSKNKHENIYNEIINTSLLKFYSKW